MSREFNIQKVNLLGKDFSLWVPKGDCTWMGAISGLQKGEFPVGRIADFQGSIILDIGCNVGIISIVLASFYPDCKIRSFDPCPWAIDCLKASAKLNNLENIEANLLAVVASDEKFIEFSHEDQGPSCFIASELTDLTTHPSSGYQCETIHIKELLQDNIKFLKMDIEGGEYKIMEFLRQDHGLISTIGLPHIELHKTSDYYEGAEDEVKEMFPNKSEYIKF